MKEFFEVLESFADIIIIIGFGAGLSVLIGVAAWHNQQKTLAEKEHATVVKEYESLSKGGVEPWQEIIKCEVEGKQSSALDNSITRRLDCWQLNTPVGNYSHGKYVARMKHIASALNFLENDVSGCAEAMQKIKALNARCVFMQKVINEYESAGSFSKTAVVTENGNILFKQAVSVNAQTLQLEAEDFRKQVAEFARVWLSDRRSPAGRAIRKETSMEA